MSQPWCKRRYVAAAGEQYADLQADQFGRQRRQSAIVPVRPAIFHLEVAALCQTVLLQAFAASSRAESSGERALMNPKTRVASSSAPATSGITDKPAAPPISATKSRRFIKPSPQSCKSHRLCQSILRCPARGEVPNSNAAAVRALVRRARAKFALPKTMLADGFYLSGVPQFSGML